MSNLKSRIFLSPPHMSGYEMEMIEQAFAENWIAPVGPHVDAFEKEVASFVGSKGAVALSSGTAAIHLALRALGVKAGDTVFCSSLTFAASANPILYLGALPIFIDSEPESWNMSPRALARAFVDAKRNGCLPKAVIVVNLYGQSADMDPLLELCEAYGVPIVEDAAESLGATYQGRGSGSLGKIGIFSFNGNKIITTSSGGMMVSDDLELLEKAKFWATQARDPAPHYQHSEMGYNYRMSNVLAGIGRGQLKVLPERIAAKRMVFERYYEALKHWDGIEFMPECDYGRANRWLTTLTIDPAVANVCSTEILTALATENVEGRPVWKPLHLQPLLQWCSYYPHEHDCSVADRLFAQGICLPSGSAMTEESQARVIGIIEQELKRGRKGPAVCLE